MTGDAPAYWYRGYGTGTGGGGVIEAQTADGVTCGLVVHLRKHSRDGMAWGYRGGQPADCARSLLVAVCGRAALCPTCAGTAAPGCLCDGGYRLLPYHTFMDEVIARLDRDWCMLRADLLWWLVRRSPDAVTWLTGGDIPAQRRAQEDAP